METGGQAGPFELSIGANYTKAAEVVENTLGAIRATINNLFTEITTNSFNSDSRGRSQAEYIEQEVKPR